MPLSTPRPMFDTAHSGPRRLPVVRQSWDNLLFMHWPVSIEALRPHVPSKLTLDTFDGSAWVGIVPFTMPHTRPPGLPQRMAMPTMHELNVRTYVRCGDKPGVYFFSLDATSWSVAAPGRVLFHLPYFKSSIQALQWGDSTTYRLRRPSTSRRAEFDAVWRAGPALPSSELGSLQFFLTERYCLYTCHRGRVYRVDIVHRPWRLRAAELLKYRSTMESSLGLPSMQGEPVLHYSETLEATIHWLLRLPEP